MTDGGGGISDFPGQYRNISCKLKKRFLRNPNVKEASEQFGSLAKHLQAEGQPHYSGYCCLAVARCEKKLGNHSGETASLIKAARLFLEAEKRNYSLRCPSFDEHLQAAVSCYNSAIKLHVDCGQNGPAAALCLELGDSLMELDRPADASEQFAAALLGIRDYDGALGVFNEMASLISQHGGGSCGAYRDMQRHCEVTRVLLLLVLQPTPLRLSPNLAQVLEKYAWTGEEGDDSGNNQTGEHSLPFYEVVLQALLSVFYVSKTLSLGNSRERDFFVEVDFLSQDLFLLLQSLVMACQAHDVDSLSTLEADLWPHMQWPEQKDLLRVLVSRMTQ
ncbi:hypothetical protein J437_LFUL013488 [Ladona fulva]|uniref:Factor VIII intron 22 protein n=1 Tax=Ladona fulva TaxID=123851 RepID=A0A8K0KKH2_LADFU|nr:hypothetical protein J437_LFUL013488 [Ladona fulva]